MADARNVRELFARCKGQEFLIFSIDSDRLLPHHEQAKLVQHLKHAQVPAMRITVHSGEGHDAFLTEPRLFNPHLQQVLEG